MQKYLFAQVNKISNLKFNQIINVKIFSTCRTYLFHSLSQSVWSAKREFLKRERHSANICIGNETQKKYIQTTTILYFRVWPIYYITLHSAKNIWLKISWGQYCWLISAYGLRSKFWPKTVWNTVLMPLHSYLHNKVLSHY